MLTATVAHGVHLTELSHIASECMTIPLNELHATVARNIKCQESGVIFFFLSKILCFNKC